MTYPVTNPAARAMLRAMTICPDCGARRAWTCYRCLLCAFAWNGVRRRKWAFFD